MTWVYAERLDPEEGVNRHRAFAAALLKFSARARCTIPARIRRELRTAGELRRALEASGARTPPATKATKQ
jgi:hypothetical protein